MDKKIIFAILPLLLVSQIALADYCFDNQTLMHEFNYSLNGDNKTMTYTEYCNYGCDNETLECNPEPFKVNLAIILGIMGFFTFLGIMLKLFKVI